MPTCTRRHRVRQRVPEGSEMTEIKQNGGGGVEPSLKAEWELQGEGEKGLATLHRACVPGKGVTEGVTMLQLIDLGLNQNGVRILLPALTS